MVKESRVLSSSNSVSSNIFTPTTASADCPATTPSPSTSTTYLNSVKPLSPEGATRMRLPSLIWSGTDLIAFPFNCFSDPIEGSFVSVYSILVTAGSVLRAISSTATSDFCNTEISCLCTGQLEVTRDGCCMLSDPRAPVSKPLKESTSLSPDTSLNLNQAYS